MNAVSPQTDRHSVSCIVMATRWKQSWRISGLPRGKHLFLRCLRQNRVQRVSAVRVMRRYGKSAIFLPRQSLHQLCVLIFPLVSVLNPNSFVISSLDMAIFPHFGHVCFSSGVFKDGIFRLINFSIKGVMSYKLVIPLEFLPVERIFILKMSISTLV